MSNGSFEVPFPHNEPVWGYAPGSAERAELEAKRADIEATLTDLEIVERNCRKRLKGIKNTNLPAARATGGRKRR